MDGGREGVMKWREHRRGEGRKRKNRISNAMLRLCI